MVPAPFPLRSSLLRVHGWERPHDLQPSHQRETAPPTTQTPSPPHAIDAYTHPLSNISHLAVLEVARLGQRVVVEQLRDEVHVRQKHPPAAVPLQPHLVQGHAVLMVE